LSNAICIFKEEAKKSTILCFLVNFAEHSKFPSTLRSVLDSFLTCLFRLMPHYSDYRIPDAMIEDICSVLPYSVQAFTKLLVTKVIPLLKSTFGSKLLAIYSTMNEELDKGHDQDTGKFSFSESLKTCLYEAMRTELDSVLLSNVIAVNTPQEAEKKSITPVLNAHNTRKALYNNIFERGGFPRLNKLLSEPIDLKAVIHEYNLVKRRTERALLRQLEKKGVESDFSGMVSFSQDS
jgi:hypothetical protein